jgi:hypothetical protein
MTMPSKPHSCLTRLVDETMVLGHVHAVHQVVRNHDGAHLRLAHGSLEGGQIDLAHGALVHVGAGVVAIGLGVVAEKVLDGGAHALGLHALDVRDRHARREPRVFAEVFEVAAA